MKWFDHSILQEKIRQFFKKSIENGYLAHAYIFYGEKGSGKEAFAIELAKALNCSDEKSKPCNQCNSCTKINHLNHPDIHYIFPTSKQTKPEEISKILKEKASNPYLDMPVSGHLNIPIEQIRDFKNEAKYASYEAQKKVFIISGAEYFSREAANSFLKLLEEPPDDLLIILITSDLRSLLDTIRSRCQPVYFPRFSHEQVQEIINRYGTSEEDVSDLIRMAQNDIKRIFRLLQEEYPDQREQVYQFLRATASSNWPDIFDIIDIISQKRDKNLILEFLDLTIHWLQDALHVKYLEEAAEYINLDYSKPIEKFSRAYGRMDYHRIISVVQRTKNKIEHNAHTALALSALAVEFKNILSESVTVMEAKAS